MFRGSRVGRLLRRTGVLVIADAREAWTDVERARAAGGTARLWVASPGATGPGQGESAGAATRVSAIASPFAS